MKQRVPQESRALRVDVHVYQHRHGWHCYVSEHGIASLAVSGINKQATAKACRQARGVRPVRFCVTEERWDCLSPERHGLGTCPTLMAFLHPPGTAGVCLALCPCDHPINQRGHVRGAQYCNHCHQEPGRAGRRELTFLLQHRGWQFATPRPCNHEKGCARAEGMFSSHSAPVAGCTGASGLPLARGAIAFLLANAFSFRTGLRRNTCCWTEETAELGKELYYQRVAQETMERSARW